MKARSFSLGLSKLACAGSLVLLSAALPSGAQDTGYPPIGASPVPNWWGMLIGTVCLMQLFTGVVLDRRYDPRIGRYFAVAVLYPVIYWMIQAVVTTWASPRAIFRRGGEDGVTRWTPVRDV